MNELEASLVLRAGAELLSSASADPRAEEGYAVVKLNLAASLNLIAEALRNFEAASPDRNRSTGWARDLHRVADDLKER
ncbi:hypothetical protein [Sinomonas mesophila]|uniref:hypothetical protein n=1 Tax=Sinomonas mesophila TaxID=1531955 RepID=UPI00098663BE|nr:hypothetical protein [Sinomonas mesophila]